MKRSLLAAVTLSLALALVASDAALAGPGRGKKGVSVNGQVSASPNSVTSPIGAENRMSICVSGFAEGNFVVISVPWVGTVDYHSSLSFSQYVGPTGGFCVAAPPDWATMNLAPGTYTIKTIYYLSGGSDERRTGPSTTFEVTGSS